MGSATFLRRLILDRNQILLHAANVLYLISYSLRDILWLRIVTVLAILMMLPYYWAYCWLTQQDLSPFVWNIIFAVINMVRIQLLIAERRPPRLSDREKRLHQLAFARLEPREMLKLLSLAEWKNVAAGEELAPENVELEHLILVYSGTRTYWPRGGKWPRSSPVTLLAR